MDLSALPLLRNSDRPIMEGTDKKLSAKFDHCSGGGMSPLLDLGADGSSSLFDRRYSVDKQPTIVPAVMHPTVSVQVPDLV
jgi:hypothetical protein